MTPPATSPASINSLSRRDAASVFHPYSDAVAAAHDGSLVITGGRGIHVRDEDGNEYIEGMSGLWCASLGFGETRLAEAAARQMRTLPFYHGFNQKSHPPQIELAERLLSLAPVTMARVFFCNSGSEAADTAVKLVWYYNNARGLPEKKKIIGRHKGYHGVTIAAASVSGTPINHAAFDLPLPGFLHTECPHHYRMAEPGESEEDFATRCAEALESLILAEGPETVAAFFAEPVMGAGGVILPPATYFEKIQAVLVRYDVLFVVDEVICGFGRTGEMWGSQTYGLAPDILTCAKALSSGYQPIAAVLIGDRVYDEIAPATAAHGTFGHGFTYSGHPVPAAVAIETLKIYEEIGLINRVRRAAARFADRLAALGEHPLVGEAAGVGLVGAVELVADRDAGTPFAPPGKTGRHAVARAQSHGLILRALGDRVAFAPPLIIEPMEIDDMFDRARRALDDTAEWVAAGGLVA